MTTGFGFLARFAFLQDLASWLISLINPAIIHNIEKYYAIKKVFYLSMLERTKGDYLEFGVYTGSSFCHSIRSYRRMKFLFPDSRTAFYGFDSFSGFGSISEEDRHPFYNDINFKTDVRNVEARVAKLAKGEKWRLVSGFFNDTLNQPASSYEIHRAAIIFVDSDTFTSSKQALEFVGPITDVGTFIILDDFYSYSGRTDRGVCRAFDQFQTNFKLSTRHVFNYGMGGAVFVVSSKN